MNMADIGRNNAFNCLLDTHKDLDNVNKAILNLIGNVEKNPECKMLLKLLDDITKIQHRIRIIYNYV